MITSHDGIRVGQRVKIKLTAFTTSRVTRVKEIKIGTRGTVLFWMEDGGVFSRDEFEAN